MKKRIWATVLLVLWMAVIFSFSAQVADESTKQSMGIVNFIKNILERINLSFEDMGEDFWFGIEKILRKIAHGFIYFILGALSLNFAYSFEFKFSKSIASGICLLYAISDEIHQIFVPGRSGQISDVMIDFTGSICGIFLFMLLYKWLKKPDRRDVNV